MNISDNDERFHELAHKALAKKAAPAEHRELRALIAENPKLKEDLAQMGGEAAVLREILPLLEDLQHPMRDIPAPPMERLRAEVGEVFEARRKSKGELRELLGKMEDWAHRQAGASREEITALVALLRESLLAREGEGRGAEPAMLRQSDLTTMRGSHFAHAAPRLMEAVEARLIEEEVRSRAELEKRLLSVEARLRQAEGIAHECRDEVRALLETLSRERERGAERGASNPNPLTKSLG